MKKSILFNTISISVFLTVSLSLVVQESSAQNLMQAPVVGFLPYQKLVQMTQEQLKNSSTPLSQSFGSYGAQSEDGRLQFVSDRVDIETTVKTQFPQGASTSIGTKEPLAVQLDLDSARIKVFNFNLKATIQQNLSFGSATLNLNVQCQQVNLTISNLEPATALVQLNQGVAQVSHLGWNLSQATVATDLIGCKDVPGFDALLKQQVQLQLQKSYVNTLLQNYINSKIDLVVHQKIDAQLAALLSKVDVATDSTSTAPLHRFDEQGNLWVYSNEQAYSQFKAEELQQLSLSVSGAILVKKIELEKQFLVQINQNLKNQNLSSDANSSLKKLTCSRWAQTFVWPSLKSLKKCFEMKIQNQITSLKIMQIDQLDFQINLKTTVLSDPHTLATVLSQSRTQLATGKTQLSQFQFNLDKDFGAWSGRSQRVSVSSVQKAFDSFLNQVVSGVVGSQLYQSFKSHVKVRQVSDQAILFDIF